MEPNHFIQKRPLEIPTEPQDSKRSKTTPPEESLDHRIWTLAHEGKWDEFQGYFKAYELMQTLSLDECRKLFPATQNELQGLKTVSLNYSPDTPEARGKSVFWLAANQGKWEFIDQLTPYSTVPVGGIGPKRALQILGLAMQAGQIDRAVKMFFKEPEKWKEDSSLVNQLYHNDLPDYIDAADVRRFVSDYLDISTREEAKEIIHLENIDFFEAPLDPEGQKGPSAFDLAIQNKYYHWAYLMLFQEKPFRIEEGSIRILLDAWKDSHDIYGWFNLGAIVEKICSDADAHFGSITVDEKQQPGLYEFALCDLMIPGKHSNNKLREAIEKQYQNEIDHYKEYLSTIEDADAFSEMSRNHCISQLALRGVPLPEHLNKELLLSCAIEQNRWKFVNYLLQSGATLGVIEKHVFPIINKTILPLRKVLVEGAPQSTVSGEELIAKLFSDINEHVVEYLVDTQQKDLLKLLCLVKDSDFFHYYEALQKNKSAVERQEKCFGAAVNKIRNLNDDKVRFVIEYLVYYNQADIIPIVIETIDICKHRPKELPPSHVPIAKQISSLMSKVNDQKSQEQLKKIRSRNQKIKSTYKVLSKVVTQINDGLEKAKKTQEDSEPSVKKGYEILTEQNPELALFSKDLILKFMESA